MALSRAAAVAVVVLALLCCTDITSAAAAAATPTRSATSISIVPGTLPEAKTIALSRQRDGEWQFDFTAANEDAFFAAENRDTKLWREWRNHVRSLRAYRQQQQLVDEEQAGTAEKKADGSPEGNAAALTNYFAERQVQRRIQSAVKQQASFNTDTTEGMRGAWTEARRNVAMLWQQLKAAGTTAAPAEKAYRELAERHFAHTSASSVRHLVPSLGANTTATAAPSALFALLRTPIVLDAEVLPQVEKELRYVRGLWQNRSSTITDQDADVVRAEVEAELRALDDVVAASRLLVARLVALADPLAQAASSWVSASFDSTHAAIVGNDGATEAKEMQLKQLLKHRSRLVKAKEVLDQYTSVFKGVLHRKQLPTADALLFALELVARQRLGDDVGNAVEVLPLLSTTAPLTALVEEEWVCHVLYPFGLCCLITAAFLWLAGEVKEWCLRRVQASRMRLGGASGRSPRGTVSNTSSRLRKLFLFACLLESVVPPLLPAVVLAVHFFNAAAWASGVLLLMRPSQRVVCVAALLGLMAASYVWGVVVRRLFQVIDPSVYRRRHAKTK